MSKMHVQEPCDYLDIEDIDKGGIMVEEWFSQWWFGGSRRKQYLFYFILFYRWKYGHFV